MMINATTGGLFYSTLGSFRSAVLILLLIPFCVSPGGLYDDLILVEDIVVDIY